MIDTLKLVLYQNGPVNKINEVIETVNELKEESVEMETFSTSISEIRNKIDNDKEDILNSIVPHEEISGEDVTNLWETITHHTEGE